MLKNILTAVLLRKKTISTLLLMVTLLGYVSYLTFPKEERPEVNLKTVAVIISYQGLVSDDMEKLVAEPLERELMSLEGIKNVISVSKDSLVQFMVQFNLDTAEENLGKFVRNKVEDSRDKFPDDIEIVEVREYDSSLFSEIKIGIYGDVPYKILHNTAEEYKKKFLGKVPIHQDLRDANDKGDPLTHSNPNHEVSKIFQDIAEKMKLTFQ